MDHVQQVVEAFRLQFISSGFAQNVLYSDREPKLFLSTLASKLRELDTVWPKEISHKVFTHTMTVPFSNTDPDASLLFYLTYNKNAPSLVVDMLVVSRGQHHSVAYPINPNKHVLPAAIRIRDDLQGIETRKKIAYPVHRPQGNPGHHRKKW